MLCARCCASSRSSCIATTFHRAPPTRSAQATSGLGLLRRQREPRFPGLGVVIHDAEDPVHGRSYAADVCPPWLAHTFLQHGDSSICPPKPLAALCALLTASERLRNRRVDNTPAWSYMINGYSSSAPMAEMGNLFHRAIMIAVLGIDCCG